MTLALQFQLTRGDLYLAVDLTVAAGKTLALVGQNGAGKTTCLHAVAGMLAIDSGRIALGDTCFDDGARVCLPPEQRQVGVLFQEHLLFPHLSARDNVAFGLRARGMPRARARELAQQWLERVDLADKAAALPRALSGGQSQRVALARALAPSPRVLLLDEPLAAVDASARQSLRRLLRDHLSQFAGPRILVSHDPLDAFALADTLAVLEAGRIVQIGDAAALSSKPRSRYVADLVGLNFFRGTLRDGVLELGDGQGLIVASSERGPATATAHPRAIALFHERPAGSPRNTWRAPILALEPALERLRVRLGGGIPVVAEVTAGAVAAMRLAPGMEVWVAIKATEITVAVE